MKEQSNSSFWDEFEEKVNAAEELYYDDEPSQALAKLEATLEICPDSGPMHFNRGLVLDALNRVDEAILEYRAALEMSPDDPVIMNSLAIDYTRTGCYDLAIQTFEKIQKLDPGYEPCYCNRIITYTEMKQHEMAEQMFYLAQQLEPKCAMCFYNIGFSLFVRGEFEQTLRCWLRTAKLEPSHPQINYRIAQAYWLLDNRESAREYFLLELRENPGSIKVILDFGLFLLETGSIESAREKFHRVLELEPDHAPALFYLGEIAFQNRKYEEAMLLFEQALERDTNLPGPRYRMAEYALMKGKKYLADKYLREELKACPKDPNVLASMGSMFLTIGKQNYATNCLLRALDLDSQNHNAYYYLGLTSAAQHMFDDAAKFFNDSLALMPQDTRTMYACALVYSIQDRVKEAQELLKRKHELENKAMRDSNESFIRKTAKKVRQALRYLRICTPLSRKKTLKRMLRSLTECYFELQCYPAGIRKATEWGGLKMSEMPSLMIRKPDWRRF